MKGDPFYHFFKLTSSLYNARMYLDMQTLKKQLQKLISSFYTVLLKGLIDIFNGAVNQCCKGIVSGGLRYNAFHFLIYFYLSFSSKDFYRLWVFTVCKQTIPS